MISEDEIFGWHHQLSGHEFEQMLGKRGQSILACCSPWGHKGLDMTQWLNIHNYNTLNRILAS